MTHWHKSVKTSLVCMSVMSLALQLQPTFPSYPLIHLPTPNNLQLLQELTQSSDYDYLSWPITGRMRTSLSGHFYHFCCNFASCDCGLQGRAVVSRVYKKPLLWLRETVFSLIEFPTAKQRDERQKGNSTPLLLPYWWWWWRAGDA